MNSRKLEVFFIVMFVLLLIVIAAVLAIIYVELGKIKEYRKYDEAVLDSAVTYLGLEKCTIIDGIPYFYYGDKKYNVIAFAEKERTKSKKNRR